MQFNQHNPSVKIGIRSLATDGRLAFWIALSAVAMFFIYPQQAIGRETVIWVNENFPPAFIIDGPEKGNGITDGAVSIYKQYLPEYNHIHMVANIARILTLMKEGHKVCYAGFIKTPEREKFIRFSLANIITYANAIIVKKELARSHFGGNSNVSLARLLQEDKLKLGLTKGRAYGGPIDTILTTYATKHKNRIIRGGDDELLGLLKMLDRERIDYTIGYPWEVAYLANQINQRDYFTAVQISETVGHRWVLSYAGCPDNAWGREFIKRLNEVLIQVRPMEQYISHLLKWYPSDMSDDIRQAYKERVLSITQ